MILAQSLLSIPSDKVSMPLQFRPTIRFGCFVLWCLTWPVIAIVLLMPLPFQFMSRTDLLGHFLLFGSMTLPIAVFTRSRMQIILLATLTIVYGVALEFGQAYVPNRTFDAADALANIAGGLAGGVGALVSVASRMICILLRVKTVIAIVLLMPLPFQFMSRTDLLGHFLLFGSMTLPIAVFTRSRMQIILLATLTIVYGVALEFGQAYVPNRTFDAADALANIAGGLAGGVGALVILRLWLAPSDDTAQGSS